MKTLVAYFSYSGNTCAAAKSVAEAVGGDLFEIETSRNYPDNYDRCIEKAREEKRADARPALARSLPRDFAAGYDVVFIGYPVWWYDAPMAIYSFVDAIDWEGKKIVPFALSGGSGLCGSDVGIAKAAKGAQVAKGILLNGYSSERIKQWARSAADDLR